jgi:hypothetical protein
LRTGLRKLNEVELAQAGAQCAHLGHGLDGLQAPFGRFLSHLYFLFAFLSAAWPGKKRVGENSPSLCPTMSSLICTGTCL